ncbi:S9 family peptidase [Lentiprolixibacter aurantiacus]|uniref:S9 family peptidase n=1 Tax=Lentiprolixibacter aurantiacus TaxID=2993939 RepID=A0AAE3SM52_9FLAO|nr:S9 family peptidase [Lentiprolixibacter aurantiacus]MCX2718080.1 S9 family peptidase [Lentiprolixibacter aurantiacus]
MNKLCWSLLFFIGTLPFATAQQKQVSLEEIWNGTFRTQGLSALHSMQDGKHYTVLGNNPGNRTVSVDQYNYLTQEKTATLVSTSMLPQVNEFSRYTFSKDEQKLLLATDIERIYRRSRRGIYYSFDRNTGNVVKISERKIQEPAYSPDGSKVAYVYENNLYVFDLEDKSTRQLTDDGKTNAIINGVTDWVYEEEFSFVKAYAWNSDGSKIAFLRFDETEVPEFSMDVYGTSLYPQQHRFKYPKAGENNAIVTLHMYDVDSGKTSQVSLGDAYYIPRMKWMNNPRHLSVQTLNRQQNNLKLHRVDVETNEVTVILEEKDAAYVDVTDDLTFLSDDSFIWSSEKDGYNHLYLHASNGDQLQQLTKGPWEVTRYYGYDRKSKRIFYQSTENGSINRGVYSVKKNGKGKQSLAADPGTNAADFSADFSYFIHSYSSATTPPRYTLNLGSSGKVVKEIKDNESLLSKLKGYQISPKEFSTLKINGNDLNMYMIRPLDFDPGKKYPMLMFQYSGPGSQQVANRWMGSRDYWHQMLAQDGYIIACVDGRGTGFKGRDFKKVTYLNLVKLETEDQIAAAKKLSELPFIDPDRTGIWGWSFGGHMSTNCLLKGNDTFEMAIAVAPVTSWRFYDTIYTERFLRTPQENPSGYDDNSPFNYPELLKGKYLLIHGSGDDNVHVQNTMRMVEALIQANKPFDWAIYPDKNHGIYGGNTSLHLFTKMTKFIKENL